MDPVGLVISFVLGCFVARYVIYFGVLAALRRVVNEYLAAQERGETRVGPPGLVPRALRPPK